MGEGVRGRSANGDAGQGVEGVQVTGGAACWTVWRRWSELRLLSTELSAEFGAGTPFNLALPALKPHALRSSGNAALLRARRRQMQSFLSRVTETSA